MSVTSATSVGAAPVSATAPGNGPGAVMGQDAFLKLLMTQLQNQDPMNTMDDKEFISQMAQFSSLEQTTNVATGLQNLSNSMALSNASTQAISLIGKTVEYADPNDSSKSLKGQVSSVKMSSSGPTLLIGQQELSLGDVISVS